MSGWRDMVKDLESGHADSAVSVFSNENAPKDTNGTNGIAPLPQSVVTGLGRLNGRPPPRFQDGSGRDAWRGIVRDALALARPDRVAGYSMAERALSLGWDAKDLFGFHSDWKSWDDWCSLSIWARGRSVLVIGERTACLSATEKTEAHFDRLRGRPDLVGVKYLWE